MAATVGQKNPFRYRGYYFDAESGMYYLQSRYYDPEIRRFISADNIIVTGIGEGIRIAKTVDKTIDKIQIAKAVDFTDKAADIVRSLDRSSGFTKSTASAGRQIHKGYKATQDFLAIGRKEYNEIKGIRPDYIDFSTKTIYELKPMNPRAAKSGIRQLKKYNKALGGGFKLRLELY